MKNWVIEPRDTLVLRDGRPAVARASHMRTLDFPWPSSVAGLVRTRLGTSAGAFIGDIAALKRVAVAGPLLAELDADGAPQAPLLPAPADCVWMEGDRGPERIRLVPRPCPTGVDTDLAHGPWRHAELQLVQPAVELASAKPSFGPQFWSWEDYGRWLLAPEPQRRVPGASKVPRLVKETRVHVSVERASQTAEDGKLFATEGLRFVTPARDRLGLVIGCDDERLTEGTVLLGGERRLGTLRRGAATMWPSFPELRPTDNRLRVLLLTPGLFRLGALPETIGGAKVVAGCVPRPRVISGWSFENGRSGPKPTRRMAPAGSVYWVEVPPGIRPLAWAQEHWMTCVSDEEQDRLDGFGLCMVGVG